MSKHKRIRLIGKRAAFNTEVWARAIEALARQLQQEAEAKNAADTTGLPEANPEASS